VAQLLDQVSARLSAFAHAAPATYETRLADVAAVAPRGELVPALRAGVSAAVEEGFDKFRQEEADRVERAWAEVAQSFRSRTQCRVDDARAAAGRLFDVTLPRVTIPVLSSETERFTYLFLQIGSTLDPVSDLAGRFVPGGVARRRALTAARRELSAEFDKHAGRVRWDLAQRLDQVRRDLIRAMALELDRTLDSVRLAADRAEAWQQLAESERRSAEEGAGRLRSVVTELAALDAS
jgi:hypothetical protein